MRTEMMWLGRFAVTGVVVALAFVGGRWLWIHYNVEPWTRDGRIRADVVHVSPDVSGLVTEVNVRNDQIVRIGDVLFVIDRPRYELAEKQAEAAVAAARASLAQAERDDRRNVALNTLVTTEQAEEGRSKVEELAAQLRSALAQRDVARLNLQRTAVRARVNGIVSNVEL